MRYRKNSERALDFELDRMWRKMRSAHNVQTGGRRAILTLALATAIFLPLADQGLPSNAAPGGDTGDSRPININTDYTFEGDNHYPTRPNPDPDRQTADNHEVIVNVSVNAAGLHVLSTAAPSQWHRANFGSANDVFWAIPDKDLTITRTTPAVNCNANACAASFSLRSSDDYVVPDTPLSLLNQSVDTDIGFVDRRMVPTFAPNSPQYCKDVQLPNSRTQVLECRFEYVGRTPTPAPPRQDLCMQIKRSATLEVAGSAALDIRWDYVTEFVDSEGNTRFECHISRFPDQNIGVHP